MDLSNFRAYLASTGSNNYNGVNLNDYVGNDVNGQGSTGINTNKVASDQSLYGKTNLADITNRVDNLYGNYAGQIKQAQTAQQQSAVNDNVNYLNDQASNINDLLNRTNTKLSQGLSGLQDQYQANVNNQTTSHNQALQDLAEKGISDTQAKQTAYDTINKNANNGYRSLAQIIGRSAGTGSSAFQDLLPNVVGNDVSDKRSTANDTYAANTAALAKAKQQDDNSFQSVIADLGNQLNKGKSDLTSQVEDQRQSLQGQLGTILGQKAQAQGGGYAQVKAAQSGTDAAIQNSRNAVDNLFNQYRAPIAAPDAAVATPDLSAYNVDRSTINAAGGGAPTGDDTNPYASLLKKQLQGAPA